MNIKELESLIAVSKRLEKYSMLEIIGINEVEVEASYTSDYYTYPELVVKIISNSTPIKARPLEVFANYLRLKGWHVRKISNGQLAIALKN